MPSALARERLAAKARRVRLVRRRIVATTLAAFVLAWGVVAFDGSMGTTTTVASTTSPDGSTSSDADADPTTSTDDTTSPDDDAAAPLTTSQS